MAHPTNQTNHTPRPMPATLDEIKSLVSQPNPEQALFDYVVREIVKQGEPSILTETGMRTIIPICRYRTPRENSTPLCCAFGMLIPDSIYSEHQMEGFNVTDLLAEGNLPGTDRGEWVRLLQPYSQILTNLQFNHDTAARSAFVASFVDLSNRDAARHQLKPYILEA